MLKIFRIVLVIGLIIGVGRAFNAHAQTETNLYSFGNSPDGNSPEAGLVQGSDGNFYGTCYGGGAHIHGTVFRISANGSYSNLYSFGSTANDGQEPDAGLVQGSDGNFYGTTILGGTRDSGTVFRISLTGTYSNLYSFGSTANDGNSPSVVLVQGSDSNFYGTTQLGGTTGYGTVFRISPAGNYSRLYSFGNSPDGGLPIGVLAQGHDGNFYGTTYEGGATSNGTIFRISPGGSYSNLYSFRNSPDGQNPFSGLVQGSDGNFYGTTAYGGAGVGTVYRISPSGAYSNLYSFGIFSLGGVLEAGLVQGSDGYFYGTTSQGGAHSVGTVFRISPSGSFSNLYSFGSTANDGSSSAAPLVQGSDGYFYGTTQGGGTTTNGIIFKLTVPPAPHLDPPLPSIPATNFNVTTYGAVGDGVTDNGSAIQSAINAAAHVGGGTVVVASVGILTNYLSGPIVLSNNVCLEIDAGTQLQMLPMASWPSPGIPFITSITNHDVAINGAGTIDGNAGFNVGATLNWWGPSPPSNSPVLFRPDFLHFSASTNILIQGVTLQNPPTFHIMAKDENVNLTIQNMTENTPKLSPNTDGMDIGSSNVLVRNCSISVGDDNIEIGSSGSPVAYMTVSNCFFGTGHGVSLGSFVNGNGEGVHDLIVSNCAFSGTDNGIRMKSDVGRGGPVHDLVYRDITINDVKYPFVIYSYYNEVGTPSAITPYLASLGTGTVETVSTPTTPAWRNITFSNITVVASNGFIAGIIWGRPDSLVSNVTFQDVTITATKSFCIYNAQGIRFIDSQLNIPGTTNSINVYNADVTITNTAAVTNLVKIGGLAIPPTNNTLAFFNATAAITDTNELGAAPITLGGSTLTLSRTPAVISNNLNVLSSSTLIFTNGLNTYSGTFNGPLALNQSAGTLQFFGSGTFTNGPASALANLSVGDCGQAIPGSIYINGSALYVTNGVQTGVLDARDGTVALSNGFLQVDTLMLTNSCGSLTLFHSGFASVSGVFSNGQSFTVGSSSTFNLLGGVQAFGTRLIVSNSGTVSGCGTITGMVTVNPGGIVEASCGGSLNFTDKVTNNGTIQATDGTVLNFFGQVFNNGVIDVRGGSVNFFGGESGSGSILTGATNSWVAGSGKWETNADWSLGAAPSAANTADLITNAGNNTITIDSSTAAATNTMTINNLVVMSNTLSLASAGLATPLHILNSLTVTNGGVLIVSNSAVLVDNSSSTGSLGSGLTVGNQGQGTVTLAGGLLAAQGSLQIGTLAGSTGLVQITSGFLVLTNQPASVGAGTGLVVDGSVTITNGSSLICSNIGSSIVVGNVGSGSLTMQGGRILARDFIMGMQTGSSGTLTVAGGTNILNGQFVAANGFISAGTVWVTGGQLVFTNAGAYLGWAGTGQMIISNGTVVANNFDVAAGASAQSQGTLTIVGGTLSEVGGVLTLGGGVGSAVTGTLWMSSSATLRGDVSVGNFHGIGLMTVSNGTVVSSSEIAVGVSTTANGTLTVLGGNVTTPSLTMGAFGCTSTGTVLVAGGNLFVTNAAHNAVLEVRSGTLVVSSGLLSVDTLVATGSCVRILHTGGVLSYGSLVVNPGDDADGDGIPNGYEQSHGLDLFNPADANADNDGDGFSNLQEYLAGTDPNNPNSALRITSVIRSNNNLFVTWTMGPGKTNALQATTGAVNGSYNTNAFADIFTVTNTVGTVTNYLDVGGVTNIPARYYRVRLVP